MVGKQRNPILSYNLDLQRLDQLIQNIEKLSKKAKSDTKEEELLLREEAFADMSLQSRIIKELQSILNQLENYRLEIDDMKSLLKDFPKLVKRNPSQAKSILTSKLNELEQKLKNMIWQIEELSKLVEEEEELSISDLLLIQNYTKQGSKALSEIQEIFNNIEKIKSEEQRMITFLNRIVQELTRFLKTVQGFDEYKRIILIQEIRELKRVIKDLVSSANATLKEDRKLLKNYYMRFLDILFSDILGVDNSEFYNNMKIALAMLDQGKKLSIKNPKVARQLLTAFYNFRFPNKIQVIYTVDLVNNKVEGEVAIEMPGRRGSEYYYLHNKQGYKGLLYTLFDLTRFSLKELRRVTIESLTVEYLELFDEILLPYEKLLELMEKFKV